MIKRSFRLMLLGAFALSSVMFVACNKYDEDIERIDIQLASLEQTVQSLKAAVDAGSVVTSVSESSTGITFKLSNGQSYVVKHGANGADGKDGINGTNGVDGKSTIITIDPETNNWIIDGVDTGICAKGKDGVDGKDGINGTNGKDGVDGKDGKDGVDGKDGKDGVDGKDGKDGVDGKDGKNAYSPKINEAGNWLVWDDEAQDWVDTQISAKGASTYVVEYDLYWELNVMQKDGDENVGFTTVKLAKTKAITELNVVSIDATGKMGPADLTLNYGGKVGTAFTFNGKPYAKNSYLIATTGSLSAIVNPIDAEVELYDFAFVDSKGKSPYKVTAVTPNMTENPLTRADEKTENKGVWDLKVEFASNTKVTANTTGVAYALTTETVNGTVASAYDVKIKSSNVTATAITPKMAYYEADDEIGTIDLTEAFTNDADKVVDYYFELANPKTDAAKGVVLNGYTLTAPANTDVQLVLKYLPVTATKVADVVTVTGITASFKYVAASGSLGNVSWTIQADASTTAVDETVVYVPLGSLQNSLMGSSDKAIPSIKSKGWTWADGTALNEKVAVRNGVEYGADAEDASDDAVDFPAVADVMPAIDGFWYLDEDDDWAPAVNGTTSIKNPLYVRFTFDQTKAFPGEFKVVLGINKAGSADASISAEHDFEVPVVVNVVAPATPAIVKNEPYFNGNNAVVYGEATATGVKVDFDELFTTDGLSFTISKVNFDLNGNGSLVNAEKNLSTWTLGAGNEVIVPLRKAVNHTVAASKLNAYYDTFNVGSTQTVKATKKVLDNDYIDASSYSFTVTAKSPVVVSYTGAAKVINNEPVAIAVDEFTGRTLKSGAAIYLGAIDNASGADYAFDVDNLQTVSIEADEDDENKKYINVLSSSFNTTVKRLNAKGEVVSTVDAVAIERVSGIALQSPVTCKVNVTVLDKWGVETVIPVNVTVNPIQ